MEPSVVAVLGLKIQNSAPATGCRVLTANFRCCCWIDQRRGRLGVWINKETSTINVLYIVGLWYGKHAMQHKFTELQYQC
jgi:hypothetical protein